ncbi:uncharacterized protein [Hetaerina americana]|uniref:uncharacterized protein n=1 Tax=Hetaerina americana TaxID=62018 RepID=UPI003A7F455E
MTTMEDVLFLLCSNLKLERDVGVAELLKAITACCDADRLNFSSRLLQMLSNPESTWEIKQGCLLGAKALVPYLNFENEREVDFAQDIKTVAQTLLTDVEVRVRLAAGEVLGSLCARLGPEIYCDCKDYVLNQIQINLERQVAEDVASRQEQQETEKLMEKLAGPPQRRNSADSAKIFHDTAGWKNLETSMKCLQAMIDGCGANFQPFVDQELLDLTFMILTHTNRFVRETGFYVCASLVACGNAAQDAEGRDSVSEVNPIFAFGHQFSQHLGKGLADNWSQVRLSASVATRKFLLSLPNAQSREHFYAVLLPRMCLNRYYVAEGVRIYSQETWRQIAGAEGKELVQKYIPYVVDYYISATESDNHAVREAACACISELGSKIRPEAVRPYVDRLLNTLLTCFRDYSWPVRDAACLACGNFISCFPEESRGLLPSLYPLFFRNLGDSIPSVRQGGAAALGSCAKVYGKEAATMMLDQAIQGLKDVQNQPSDTEKYASDLSEREPGRTSPLIFGVITKRQRDNDLELHTDQQMYSCGSLAPKLGRGCDHKFQKPPQPWEMADGCVHLVAELVQIPWVVSAMPTNATASAASSETRESNIISAINAMSAACHYKHYAYHLAFHETVCKQLPVIARGLGKKAFKAVVADFFDAIFYSLECENALTSSAASQCLNQLGTFLGPSILRARVEQHNPNFVHHLDANVFIAPL